MNIEAREIDLHQIVLRYAHTRVKNETVLRGLRRSVERYGQITPVLVVPNKDNRFVLIDGYLRVEVIRMCGKDTVIARIWETGEVNALLTVLARSDARQWEAVEQASMLSELMVRFELSMEQVAKRVGRDKSWVKRRLDLIRALPEDVLSAVRAGHVSTWAASRILAPLARANTEHAQHLTAHLLKDAVSTRELDRFYAHYKKSNRNVRNKMINNPALFLKAARSRDEDKTAMGLNKGPEGAWLKDMNIVFHILLRLKKQLPTVFYPQQSEIDLKELVDGLKKAKAVFEYLHKEIISHDRSANPADNRGDA
ncbi:MAG: ParB N-terminal domain-containing protein [Deltaproteobacteria bacterium]|nr:ParB N-terminal domain-containing protein [Deltaproteobacteria bacterium]